MKKKITAALLCAAMVLSLSGCAGDFFIFYKKASKGKKIITVNLSHYNALIWQFLVQKNS